MTDIAIGRALWNDLARQAVVRAREYDDATDLLHTVLPKLIRYRAQPPVNRGAASLKNVAIARRPEDSATLRREAVGTLIRPIETKGDLDELRSRIWKTIRSRPCKRVKRESVNSETK